MFLCLVALALPALGFTVGTILYGAAHNRFLMLTVLFAALGCYGTVMMIRYAVKFRIALWPDRIEVRSARRTITIRRRDIAGFRRVKATRMLFWGRVPHRLTYVSRFLRSDGELDAWIDSLPDYETILKLGEKHDASSDPSLGHTRAERLARFRSAKLIDTILGIIGFGVGLWVWLYPEPYLLSLLSLAAFPWVLIAIEKLSGTDRFFGPNRWRMSSAIVLFWISGLFIVLPSPFIISNVYQMEPIRTMALGLVGGSVLTAILIWWDVRVRRTPLLLVCTLIGACLYAGGSLYAATSRSTAANRNSSRPR